MQNRRTSLRVALKLLIQDNQRYAQDKLANANDSRKTKATKSLNVEKAGEVVHVSDSKANLEIIHLSFPAMIF